MSTDVLTGLLFSYGTLQSPQVQLDRFGRLLEGEPGTLPGHRVTHVRITDPEVISVSGSDLHPVVTPAAQQDAVAGTVFRLTDAEFAAADDYETDDYVRTRVTLGSGATAWAYLSANVSPARDGGPDAAC
ncbi:gamma-glutamylcyclotransferase family protein [Streptomyces sp. NPDC089799]|uniref:gamma-glutamylcyclotransferase family protein n=1 Tax=Streptomyces sp. NPDC089799 TaxID=3155066 RepID=UPI00343E7E9C